MTNQLPFVQLELRALLVNAHQQGRVRVERMALPIGASQFRLSL